MTKHVMVFGTFDLLHPGHRYLIDEARKRGRVTVVVARAENVKRIKGRRPDQTDEERVTAIKSAYPDVMVVLGSDGDFLAPIRTLRPDLLLFGYDQRLPPGVTESDLLCPIERAEAHRPDLFKSSLMRNPGQKGG
jgi:FAD synthetase